MLAIISGLATFFSFALAAPLARRSGISTDAVIPISNATLDAFRTHALLAQAAYCSNATAALPNIDMILVGGDGGLIPRFFVGHDKGTNNVVVGHEGTVADNPFSIANDVQFTQGALDPTFFPNAPAGVEVHKGFAATFARTADDILGAVKKAVDDNGASTVLVSGHSLGAALSVMTSVFLKNSLDSSVNISTAVFGLPRGGNQAWADFVDTSLPGLRHMHNKHDIVPTIPPRFLNYQHPSGELFIQPVSNSQVVFCPGQENQNCSEGNETIDDDISDHDGPYIGALMGRKNCPVGGA